MAKQTLKPRVRKKKWFQVLAPKLFREHVVGEIPLYESKAMLNRSLVVNMMNLTGNPRNQHANVILRINEVKEGKGLTQILGFEVMPSSVKRIVRRGRTKISDSVIVATSDNKKVKIKPLIITNTTVNNSIATSIRLRVRDNLARLVSRLTYEKLVEEIMSFKLQRHLGSIASKIAPVRGSEIRGFKLIEKEGVRVLKPVKIKEPEKIVEEKKEEKEKEGIKEKVAEEKAEEKEKPETKKEEVKEEVKEEKKKEELKEEKPETKKEEVKEEKQEEKKPEVSQKSEISETLRNEVSGAQKRKDVSRELETASQTKEVKKEEPEAKEDKKENNDSLAADSKK